MVLSSVNWIPKRVAVISSAWPLIWFAGVLFEYIRARIYLGYWPLPSRNDPKGLPFEVHHLVLQYGLYFLFYSIPLVLIFWVIQFKTSRKKTVRSISSFLIGWALILGTFNFFENNMIEWFLD